MSLVYFQTSLEQKTPTDRVKILQQTRITSTGSTSPVQDLPEQTFIDLQRTKQNTAVPQQHTNSSKNFTLQKLDPTHGAIPKTNLNKGTCGSTLTLFDGAREVVENAVTENFIRPAMQVLSDVAKEENNNPSAKAANGKSRFAKLKSTFVKSLPFGKKTKGLLGKEKETKHEVLHRQTSREKTNNPRPYSLASHTDIKQDIVTMQYPDSHYVFNS